MNFLSKNGFMDVLDETELNYHLASIAYGAIWVFLPSFFTKDPQKVQIFANKKIGATSYECSLIAPIFRIAMQNGGIDMRKYYLASQNAKQNVDLRDYEDVIVSAVMDVMKDVEGISVVVRERYYELSISPSRSQAVAIGHKICKSSLSQHCVQIPKLFSSREVLPKGEKKNGEKKNSMGGHM